MKTNRPLTYRGQTFRDYSFSNKVPYEEQNNSLLSLNVRMSKHDYFGIFN